MPGPPAAVFSLALAACFRGASGSSYLGACHETCLGCSGSFESDCTSCRAGFFVQGASNYCRPCPSGCSRCSDSATCSECQAGFVRRDASRCALKQYAKSCDWTQEDWEGWYARMVVGVVVGAVVAFILVVFGLLPVCFGYRKETNLRAFTIPISVLAAVCYFVPLVSALASSGSAIENHCDECGRCTEKDREEFKALLGIAASVIAYIHGFGFVVVVLATIAECLVCCMCCPCFGPLKTYRDQQTSVSPAVMSGTYRGQGAGAVVVGTKVA